MAGSSLDNRTASYAPGSEDTAPTTILSNDAFAAPNIANPLGAKTIAHTSLETITEENAASDPIPATFAAASLFIDTTISSTAPSPTPPTTATIFNTLIHKYINHSHYSKEDLVREVFPAGEPLIVNLPTVPIGKENLEAAAAVSQQNYWRIRAVMQKDLEAAKDENQETKVREHFNEHLLLMFRLSTQNLIKEIKNNPGKPVDVTDFANAFALIVLRPDFNRDPHNEYQITEYIDNGKNPFEGDDDKDASFRKAITSILHSLLVTVESEKTKTDTSLALASLAMGIFLVSSLISTKDLEIGGEYTDLIRLLCGVASGTSNFAVYAVAILDTLSHYWLNTKEIFNWTRDGFVHNGDGKMVHMSVSEKIDTVLSSFGYSAAMTALLVSTFLAFGPIGFLLVPFVLVSLMLSLRFNNNFYVNDTANKMLEKLSGFTGQTGVAGFFNSVKWAAFFSGAFTIAAAIGFTMFQKIFLLANISLAPMVAASPWFWPVAAPLALALLILGVKTNTKFTTYLKYISMGILFAASAAALLMLMSTVGWQAVIVVAATFVGIYTAKVIFKMLSNTLVTLPTVWDTLLKVTEDKGWATKIITWAVIGLVGGILVTFNAFAQAFISMFGLTDPTSGALLFFNDAWILLGCNAINSFVLGLSSWMNQFNMFIPGILTAIEKSDFNNTWSNIIANSPIAGRVAQAMFYLIPVCIAFSLTATTAYIATSFIESLSLFMTIGLAGLGWAMNVAPKNKSTEEIVANNSASSASSVSSTSSASSTSEKTLGDWAKTISFALLVRIPVGAVALASVVVGIAASPVYLAAHGLKTLIGKTIGTGNQTKHTNEPSKAKHDNVIQHTVKTMRDGFDDFMDTMTPSVSHVLDTTMNMVPKLFAPAPDSKGTAFVPGAAAA